MTNQASTEEFPAFAQVPRDVNFLEGDAVLSQDVRLMTRDVAPLYRKTMRTIFASAGIRVVANKKKFIIDVRVVDRSELQLEGVPAEVEEEYYELRLQGNQADVRTAGQLGALWGSQALASLYRSGVINERMPNVLIRDWPTRQWRGLRVQNGPGFSCMDREDWVCFLDGLCSLRINHLVIPFFATGYWVDREYAFFNASFDEETVIATPVPLTWYSPDYREQHDDEERLPCFHDAEVCKEIITSSREKGLSTIPAFDVVALHRYVTGVRCAGKSFASTDECLADADAREAVAAFYAGFFERFFTKGADAFCIDLPAAEAGVSRGALEDYLAWLKGVLAEREIGRFVVSGSTDEAMDLAAGLGDACVHWLPAGKAPDQAAVAWYTPLVFGPAWPAVDGDLEGLPETAAAATDRICVAGVAPDPVWKSLLSYYAAVLWNPDLVPSVEAAVRRWTQAVTPVGGTELAEAHRLFFEGHRQNPDLYGAVRRLALPLSPRFPADALDDLVGTEAEVFEAMAGRCDQAAEHSRAAAAAILASEDKLLDRTYANSLTSELVSLSVLSKAAAVLVPAYTACRSGDPIDLSADACEGLIAVIDGALKEIEVNKPKGLRPFYLNGMARLRMFLAELGTKAADGSVSDSSWSLCSD